MSRGRGQAAAQLGLGFAAPTQSVQPQPIPANDLPEPIPTSAPAPTAAKSRRLPDRSGDIGDPAQIAGEIARDLGSALDIMEGLERELAAPTAAAAIGEQWAVFVSDGNRPPEPPLLVSARGRHSAEYEASRLLNVPERICFAVPARETYGALPLDEHPRRPATPPPPADLADAFTAAMQRQIRRVDEDMAETMRATADLLGCSVAELDERLKREQAERDQEKAARKAEQKAQRQPAPRGRAKVAKNAPAIEAGKRLLTERQRELLGLVEVDPRTNRVVYTRDEHVPDWAALKQVVEALGGSWVGKSKKTKGGWAFPEDVDAMDAITLARESGEILDPKLLGFFPTSDSLADALVARLDIRPGDRVLEPSAGDGAIARAVLRACPEARVFCVELLPENRGKLTAHGLTLIGEDFLAVRPEGVEPFDVVAGNPPFGKGRPEIHHTLHMLRFLRHGGRLGVILPTGIRDREDALTTSFRSEMAKHGAAFADNPPGAFKSAGTMVSTVSAWLRFTG